MNMGRPFPTLKRTAEEWWDVLIRACVILALLMVAAALHPMVLIVLIALLYALLDEKQLWLKSRLDRMEDTERADRLARSGVRANPVQRRDAEDEVPAPTVREVL